MSQVGLDLDLPPQLVLHLQVVCGWAGVQVCGFAVVRVCRYASVRVGMCTRVRLSEFSVPGLSGAGT